MITIDSLKVYAPMDGVLKVRPVRDTCKRDYTHDGKTGAVETNRIRVMKDALPVGVANLVLDELKHEVMIELSAKVLLRDYHRGICTDTIEQVIDAVNRNTAGMVVDAKGIIENAIVGRSDNSVMFVGEHSCNDYIDSVEVRSPMGYWNKTMYDSKGRTDGVVLRKQVAAANAESIVIYDKGKELLLPRNSGFLNAVGGKYIQELQGMIRVEAKAQNYKILRRHYGIAKDEKPKLLLVLNANTHPIHDTLKGAIEDEPLSLYTCYDDLTWGRYKDRLGVERIIHDTQGDIDAIKRIIARHTQRQNIKRILRTDILPVINGQPEMAKRIEKAAKVWADFMDHLRAA